ncbi:hypothetical protein P692DRAFT_20455409 [Suillus brevipes Sb2]|nr:hypothetical protein P692DRAFT_20455409 [Suillus brevipes Sb2]
MVVWYYILSLPLLTQRTPTTAVIHIQDVRLTLLSAKSNDTLRICSKFIRVPKMRHLIHYFPMTFLLLRDDYSKGKEYQH